MKKIMNTSIPIILTISLVLLLNTGSANIYGQTNQTSGQNTTQQTQQQLDQANQQLTQANQTQPQQANQTQPQQANQTQPQQANQTQPQNPELGEKLLNYTNAAILALNDDDTTAAQDNLVQIQKELINASGKQVVVVPAPAVSSPSDDSDGDSG